MTLEYGLAKGERGRHEDAALRHDQSGIHIMSLNKVVKRLMVV